METQAAWRVPEDRFVNCTDFRDDHLFSIIERALVLEVEQYPELREKIAFDVEFAPAEWGPCRNWPHYGNTRAGYLVQLWLPRSQDSTFEKVEFAHTIAHESTHVRGIQHESLGNPRYDHNVPGWRELYAWAELLPLEDVRAALDRAARLIDGEQVGNVVQFANVTTNVTVASEAV